MAKTGSGNGLAIVTLILTILAPVLLALYIENRERSFQTELAQIQSELEAKIQKELADYQSELETTKKYTHIVFESNCVAFCSGFRIVNKGLTNAENVRIVIYVFDVANGWEPIIDDINVFELTSSPPVIDTTVTEERVNEYSYFSIRTNNSFRVEIPSLAPGAALEVKLELKTDGLNLETRTLDKTFLLSRGDGRKYLFPDPVDQLRVQSYFEKKFWIADFRALAYCENCIDVPPYNPFIATALTGFRLGSGFRIIDDATVSLDSSIRYTWPVGSEFQQIGQTELNLEFVNYGEPDYFVTDKP